MSPVRKTRRASGARVASPDEASSVETRGIGGGGGGAGGTARGETAELGESTGGLRPTPIAVEEITPRELASIPPASSAPEASGAEAARAALEAPTQLSGSNLAGEPAPSVEGVLELAETGLGLLCMFLGKWEAKPLEDPAHFTDGEREMLRIFAPATLPYVGQAANLAPEVSAAAFLGVLGSILWARFKFLRTEAKRSSSSATPAREAQPANGRAPTAEEVQEHKRAWGHAADAVPVGATPKDVGLPPKFVPSLEGR